MNKPTNPTPVPWAYSLWTHLHTEHGLTLTESELDEIIRICRGLDMGRNREPVRPQGQPSGRRVTEARD